MNNEIKPIGVWDNIYMRCLEIDKARDTNNDLEELASQLSTINESLPVDIDPVEDYELFVISKLCLSTAELLNIHLRKKCSQKGAI